PLVPDLRQSRLEVSPVRTARRRLLAWQRRHDDVQHAHLHGLQPRDHGRDRAGARRQQQRHRQLHLPARLQRGDTLRDRRPPPAASTATVTGTGTQLSVLGTDEQQNEANLTYTWALAGGPAGAQATFSVNGTNAAKSTTVTFTATGTYRFVVTVTDVNGLSTTSTVNVTVV